MVGATTSGWSTLIDSLRRAGFTITEAWLLDTEMGSRLRGQNSAALASSIFLIARKRPSPPSPLSQKRGGEDMLLSYSPSPNGRGVGVRGVSVS